MNMLNVRSIVKRNDSTVPSGNVANDEASIWSVRVHWGRFAIDELQNKRPPDSFLFLFLTIKVPPWLIVPLD